MKLSTALIFVLFAGTGLAGCYEDLDVTLHKSHIYKGRIDKHENDPKARAEQLEQRFQLVQTDR